MDAASTQNSIGASPRCESLTVDFDALFGGFRPIPGGDGYTTAEIKAATGWGDETTRKRIRSALEAGVCKRGQKWLERIDGRMTSVPAYVFERRQ